jgi:hypothetical protein
MMDTTAVGVVRDWERKLVAAATAIVTNAAAFLDLPSDV